MNKLGKLEDYLKLDKLKELFGKEKKKKKSPIIVALVVVGAVVVAAGIGYAIYRYFSSDSYDEFADDYEELDDDYFEDESEMEE